MADRYWVGGTATWDATAGTKWSTTDGGPGGAAVPTSADNVYFTALSGAVTVTAGGQTSKSLICTGFTGTLTLSGAVTVAGSFTLSAGMTYSGSPAISFTSTASGNTITTAGKTLGSISFSGVGGVWDLQDAIVSNNTITLIAGTLNTNGYALTAPNITTSGTNVKVWNWGASVLTCTQAGSFLLGGSNQTINAGTSKILMTATPDGTFNGGNQVLYDLEYTGTPNVVYKITLSGNNTFHNLTFKRAHKLALAGNQTINGQILFSDAAAGNARFWLTSDAIGITRELVINSAQSWSDIDFWDIRVTGSAAPVSGTRLGDAGGNSGITFPAPKTVYPYRVTGTTNASDNIWVLSPGSTSPSTDNFPLPQDTVKLTDACTWVNDQTITWGTGQYFMPSHDATGKNGNVFIFVTPTGGNVYCTGSILSGPKCTYGGNVSTTIFVGRGTSVISLNGTQSGNVTCHTISGTVELGSSITWPAISGTLTVTSGTFDTKNYAVSVASIASSGILPRTIKLGSSAVSLTGNAWCNITAATNLTFDAGTSTITCTYNGGSPVTSGVTFYDVILTDLGNSPSIPTSTFHDLTIRSGYQLTGDIVITGTLKSSGRSANTRGALWSSVAGTTRTITAAAATITDTDFIDIKLAGAAAGTSLLTCGDAGGNSGIVFAAPKTVYWNLAGNMLWSDTGWALTSGGTPNAANYPLPQDTAVINNASAGTSVGWGSFPPAVMFNIDCSSRTTPFTIGFATLSGSSKIPGSLKLGAGITVSSNVGITLAGRGAAVLRTNGVSFNGPVAIDAVTGTVTLEDAFTLSSTRNLTLTSGTFDASSYAVTVSALLASGSVARTLKMGTATWTLFGIGTVWDFTTTTNLTLYKGSANIVLSDTSTTARTFVGGTQNYNKLTVGGTTGTSTLTISGTNTFTELAATKTVAHTVTLGASQTVGKWSITGTAGNVVTFNGAFTLTLSGPCTTGIDYLSIASVTLSSTSRGEFFAGANSTSTGTNFTLTATPAPRTLYWVGGSANWDDATLQHWSLSDNGAVGQAKPTSLDDVIFSSTSVTAGASVSFNALVCRCKSLTTGAFSMTLSGSGTLIIHNALSISPSTTVSMSAGIVFSGTGAGKTIDAGGKSLPFTTVDGIGASWTLTSAYTTTSTFQVNNGSFDTAGYALTTTQISAINSGDRTVSFGSSAIALTTTAANGTPIDFTADRNLQLNAASSTITISNGSTPNNIKLGNYAYGTILLTGKPTSAPITGSGSINALTITTPTSMAYISVTFSGNWTIGTLTAVGGTANQRVFIGSSVFGTQRTLALTSFTCSDIDFQDIALTGAGAPFSGTRLGDCKGNSGVTFDAPKTVYWNLAGSQNWTATGWATTSTGAPAVNNFPLAQDTAVFTNAGAAGTITINWSGSIGTIDMSGRTSAMTFSNNAIPWVYGDILVGTGVTWSRLNSNLKLASRGTQYLNCNGVTIGTQIFVNSPGGTVKLSGALVYDPLNNVFTVTTGTFDANGYAVTLPNIAVATATVNQGSGLWTFTGTGTIPTFSGTPTWNKQTADILLSDMSTTARTFAGNGFSYNKLTIGGATGVSTTTITGNNTFTELASTKTVAHTISLGSTYQTVGAWSITGTAGNMVTLQGTSAAAPALLLKTGGGTVNVGYLNLNFVQAYPYTAAWYAGVNSVCGGCYGFIFTSDPGIIKGIVYSGGLLQEYTSSGARVRLDTGLLKTTAGGVSLVWDKGLKILRQAAAGETVITP